MFEMQEVAIQGLHIAIIRLAPLNRESHSGQHVDEQRPLKRVVPGGDGEAKPYAVVRYPKARIAWQFSSFIRLSMSSTKYLYDGNARF